MTNWDAYFMSICDVVASNSKCLSRKIGAVIVRDNSILSTGYNGPPRGVPQCYSIDTTNNKIQCPRRTMGYASGEELQHCPAAHAETNAIAQAARMGVSIRFGSLYLNTVYPCKDCMALIINAGIIEVVAKEDEFYSELTKYMVKHNGIVLRKAEL